MLFEGHSVQYNKKLSLHSVLFYTELASRALDKEAVQIFEEIIFQEKAHLRTLQLRLAKLTSEG